MLEIHITPVVFNRTDVTYRANAQTLDFVTSQFTLELLGLVPYPFFQIYVCYKMFFIRIIFTYEDIFYLPNLCINYLQISN